MVAQPIICMNGPQKLNRIDLDVTNWTILSHLAQAGSVRARLGA